MHLYILQCTGINNLNLDQWSRASGQLLLMPFWNHSIIADCSYHALHPAMWISLAHCCRLKKVSLDMIVISMAEHGCQTRHKTKIGPNWRMHSHYKWVIYRSGKSVTELILNQIPHIKHTSAIKMKVNIKVMARTWITSQICHIMMAFQQ